MVRLGQFSAGVLRLFPTPCATRHRLDLSAPSRVGVSPEQIEFGTIVLLVLPT